MVSCLPLKTRVPYTCLPFLGKRLLTSPLCIILAVVGFSVCIFLGLTSSLKAKSTGFLSFRIIFCIGRIKQSPKPIMVKTVITRTSLITRACQEIKNNAKSIYSNQPLSNFAVFLRTNSPSY